VGRQLLLLDLMPGHGRDNLQHELELGAASVCTPTADGVTASALALRDHAPQPVLRNSPVARWEPAFAAALQRIGVNVRDVVPAPRQPAASRAPTVHAAKGVEDA
jgi:processive 1,2-diacylglycerol beta-glucosyltransferase